MRKALLILLVVLAGCTTTFLNSSLNNIELETSKAQFFAYWQSGCKGGTCDLPIVRAAKTTSDGLLTEVVTIVLVDNSANRTEHWFVFKAGRLKQWGRPEDWQQVAARYEVAFNPTPSVRQ
jgi:hypothetical protein